MAMTEPTADGRDAERTVVGARFRDAGMNSASYDGQPCLFVLDQDGRRGRRVPFPGTELRVGRDAGSDLVLEGPDVSRRHALLWREGDRIHVEDLGSTAGTSVNGTPLTGPQALRAGDVVAFASARLEVDGAPVPTTRRAADPPPREAPRAADGPRFDVRDQRAESINMVGGNQYTMHVLEERHNILLDVAATKTKARWILLCGFLIAVAGAAFFAAGILRFFMALQDAAASGEVPTSFIDPFGVEFLGIPSGLIGWAAAAIGIVLMFIGGVLHLMAVGRQKRMERELPLPRPRQAHGGTR